MVMALGQRLHTQARSSQLEVTLVFPEINTGYPRNQHTDFAPWFQNGMRSLVGVGQNVWFRICMGIFQRSDGFTPRQSRVKWWRNPHHDSSQLFYLHGLGLTLVTHETACIPSACIPSIWKLLVFPKRT
jgi:hypothetical protein